jgi:adenine-specific DNA-methyltransferase
MEFKHLPLTTEDGAQLNLNALYKIAPSCFTEAPDPKDPKKLRHVVDFKKLRQLLGDNAVENEPEAYDFTWVGKQAARLEAATPINKTLRPCPEKSVDWDKTQNIYIEGDNLDALKLLQKYYNGKIKMMYFDPPYNTGSDFVYYDNFRRTQTEEDLKAGNIDEFGNRFVKNTEANGKFHSDWCSMIYPRLTLAKSLLSEDGVIFISIDDGELSSLRGICDEIFGASNFRNTLLVRRRIKSLNSQFADNGLYSLNIGFEYILVYSKSNKFLMKALRMKKADIPTKGRWDVFWSNADRPTMRYEILGFTPKTGQWRNSKEKADKAVANYIEYEKDYSSKMTLEEYSLKTGIKEFIRRIPNATGKNGGVQHWIAPIDTMLRTSNWTDLEVSQIGKEIDIPFDNPKNKILMMELIRLCSLDSKDFIVADFFSGSATTAHAVMQLNSEDGGHRKFVMAQLPEVTEKGSDAYNAGFNNICEMGEERIRRAGKKIKEDSPLTTQDLDTGFRVFKVDSSNMKDVYFAPKDLDPKQLELFEDNVKEDRSELDLLYGCMVDWGVQLSLPLTTDTIDGVNVYTVNEGDLVACFGNPITDNIVKAMAAKTPLRVLFRDSCFDKDEQKINIYEQFKQLLGWSDDEALNNIQVI